MKTKYTDWRTWWNGLRTNLFKCIGTTGTAWLGTNAAAASGIPIHGIDWEQALTLFGVHIALEIFQYIKENQPQIVEQEVDTATFTKEQKP